MHIHYLYFHAYNTRMSAGIYRNSSYRAGTKNRFDTFFGNRSQKGFRNRSSRKTRSYFKFSFSTGSGPLLLLLPQDQIGSSKQYVFFLFLRKFHYVNPFKGNFCEPGRTRFANLYVEFVYEVVSSILFCIQPVSNLFSKPFWGRSRWTCGMNLNTLQHTATPLIIFTGALGPAFLTRGNTLEDLNRDLPLLCKRLFSTIETQAQEVTK